MRWLAGLSLLLMLTGCGEYNDKRGRGDAPVGTVDRNAPETLNFSDRYSNVQHKCDGHGHRVYVSSRSENVGQMEIIDDPSCAGGPK